LPASRGSRPGLDCGARPGRPEGQAWRGAMAPAAGLMPRSARPWLPCRTSIIRSR